MSTYEYQARDMQGKMVKGRAEASDEEAVAAQLMEKNLIPINIKRGKGTAAETDIFSIEIFAQKVKLTDLMALCRQMYTLTKSGIAITIALKQIGHATDNKTLKRALFDCETCITSGQTLTQAFQRYPKIFSNLFVSIIDAGENSGQLDQAFLQLASHLEFENATIKRIKSASRYPIMIIVSLLAALMVINFMVIPAFSTMYATFDSALPLPTRILLGTSNFLIAYWPALLIGVIVAFFCFRYYVKTKNGKYIWSLFRLKIPIVGSIYKRILLGRFTRTFAIMLRTSIPLIKGLELVSNTLDNEFVKQKVLLMRDGVSKGETLTKAASSTKLFPPLIIQMLNIGEASGEIEELLENIAEYYELEVDYDLGRLTELLEPILLIIMGGMVLLLALGVFLPIWDLISAIRK